LVVAGVAIVRAAAAGMGNLGGKEARRARGEAHSIRLQKDPGFAIETVGGGGAGGAVSHAHRSNPRAILVVANPSHAACASIGDDAVVDHSITRGALAIEGAVLAIQRAGDAGEGGVVREVVGRTGHGAQEVEV
jgi:hypothetical protein